ncbi:MAG: fused MFS/spermidine synthase [Mobilicoccus sp.]|nr:fused MFS/spermidine synthase [Mobilicoccus sp.]
MAEFVRDAYGVSILVGGHPQSHVPDDPHLLIFEYMQHLTELVDTLPAAPPARLAVTHIGGAGLTLARYIHHTRPGSPQIVLEPDAELTERVRQETPLPRGHRIRVRAVTGEEGVPALRRGSADVVVLDAFADGRIPGALTTREFLTQVAGVLAPDGLFLANLSDEPGLRYVARVAATVGAVGLTHRALVATHDVFKGRRHGNVVLAARRTELDIAEVDRRLRRSPFPTSLRTDVAGWSRGAAVLTDADPQSSPAAPDPGTWRVR